MGHVVLAALCVAGFAILFRYFERYNVPLLPAIAINYSVAFLCGLLVAPPWQAPDVEPLLLPASLLGSLFVLIFSLTGLSAQRAGAARTTIAGRMSLVLTIAGAVLLFNERLSAWSVMGIILALAGLVLSSMPQADAGTSARSSYLPFVIFLCSGIADISVTYVQRVFTTEANASTFPTLCFGASALVSMALLFIRGEQPALRHARAWVGGVVLGVVNYASLLFLVWALGAGTYPASIVFPAMNILAIIVATGAGLLLFKERLHLRQWSGIAMCVVALILFMASGR